MASPLSDCLSDKQTKSCNPHWEFKEDVTNRLFPDRCQPEFEPRVSAHPSRLAHGSLDATLACLKGKDAASEEAQEHANSSCLALCA